MAEPDTVRPQRAGIQQAPAFCSQKFSNCCGGEPVAGGVVVPPVWSVAVPSVVGAVVPPLVPVVVGAVVPPLVPDGAVVVPLVSVLEVPLSALESAELSAGRRAR